MKKTTKNLDYYLSLPYSIEIIPDTEEGGFTARYPDLPGCITCAETLEDVITNAKDAKVAWLTVAIEDGIAIPEPGLEQRLEAYSGQFKLRMPKSLHRSHPINAKKEWISIASARFR